MVYVCRHRYLSWKTIQTYFFKLQSSSEAEDIQQVNVRNVRPLLLLPSLFLDINFPKSSHMKVGKKENTIISKSIHISFWKCVIGGNILKTFFRGQNKGYKFQPNKYFQTHKKWFFLVRLIVVILTQTQFVGDKV